MKPNLKISFKQFFVVLSLLASAAVLDSYVSKNDVYNAIQSRILGTGVKTACGKCIMGTQSCENSFTILWMQVGESWSTYNSCSSEPVEESAPEF